MNFKGFGDVMDLHYISYGSIEKSNGSLHGMSRNTTTDWIPTTSFRSQKKLASRTWLLNVILGISTLVGQ